MPDDRPKRLPTTPRESAPHFITEETTGVIDGVELERVRERRPTPERFKALEVTKDEHTAQISALEKSHLQLAAVVGEVVGQLKVLPKLFENLEKAVDRMADERKSERDEAGDIRKTRRERITLALKGIVGGGALIEAIHRWIL